jgi:secondary thiamine-phosphate synthase enzyme
MAIKSSTIQINTSAEIDIVDITDMVASEVAFSGAEDGAVLVFIPGSTAALTTIEFESGVVNDLKRAIKAIIPEDIAYEHDKKWGDGNGHAHVRAAMLGPSLSIPILRKKMTLGTWQQIVLCDFDNRPRLRDIIIQVHSSS